MIPAGLYSHLSGLSRKREPHVARCIRFQPYDFFDFVTLNRRRVRGGQAGGAPGASERGAVRLPEREAQAD